MDRVLTLTDCGVRSIQAMVALTAGIARIDLPARRALTKPLHIDLMEIDVCVQRNSALSDHTETRVVTAHAPHRGFVPLTERKLGPAQFGQLFKQLDHAR